jgi:hypothetical protein
MMDQGEKRSKREETQRKSPTPGKVLGNIMKECDLPKVIED